MSKVESMYSSRHRPLYENPACAKLRQNGQINMISTPPWCIDMTRKKILYDIMILDVLTLRMLIVGRVGLLGGLAKFPIP